MGIEGKTWQKTDDDKWEWILGNGYGDDVGTVRSSSTIQGAANHPSIWPNYWYNNMSPEVDPDEVYLNEQRAKMATDGKVPLPVMNYSEEDGLTIATLTADINSYIDQYVAQVAKENGAKITVKKFVRFETGEGIEKKEENFAEEVAKQMGQ